jgi:Ca-activated chloride channel family protein
MVSFQWPAALYGLAALPLVVAGYLLLQRRRSRYTLAFTNVDLLANLVERTPGWRRHLPPALFLAALAASVIALARPEGVITVPRERATVVLTTDTSGSMGATDVEPTRLGAAKNAANLLLDQLPAEIQVALVTFSTEPRVIAPPTRERELLRAGIDAMWAEGRTALGDAIAVSVDLGLYGARTNTTTPAGEESDAPPISVLLLSDGANSTGTLEPLEAVQLAIDSGIPIFTIALGTPQGTVQVIDNTGTLQIVAVPPDRETLKAIAERTGGLFFDAPTAEDLQAVYRQIGSEVGFVEEQQELTFLFTAAAGVLMLVGAGLSALWFNRIP